MKQPSYLVSVNVKIGAEKRELANLKGINLSELFRESLDLRLGLDGGDYQMLQEQYITNQKKIETLTLENKLIMDLLDSMSSNDMIEEQRNVIYNKWSNRLAFMVSNNKIDWNTQQRLFNFSNIVDCKKWLLNKLKEDNLI